MRGGKIQWGVDHWRKQAKEPSKAGAVDTLANFQRFEVSLARFLACEHLPLDLLPTAAPRFQPHLGLCFDCKWEIDYGARTWVPR